MTKLEKSLAILLCLAMFISLLPTWALAEEELPTEEPAAELMQEAVQEEPETELPEQAAEPEAPAKEAPVYEETVIEEPVEEVPPEPSEGVFPKETPDTEQSFTVEEPESQADAGSVDTEVGTEPLDTENAEPTTEQDAQESVEPAEEIDAVPVKLVFTVTPENAELVIYTRDEYEEKTEIDPEEDGSYLLLPGAYFYTLKAEEYAGVEEESLTVEPSEEPIEVELTLVPVQPEEGAGITEEAVLQAETKVEEKATLMAASGTCGENLTWTLDDEGTLTIKGEGDMWPFNSDYQNDPPPWSSYAEQIVTVTIEEGVTSISDYAFHGLSKVKEINVPASVRSVGWKAFYNCSSLITVQLPADITEIEGNLFSGCSSLERIEIPPTVTMIGMHAFSECSSLRSVTIPNGVTSIRDGAFFNCSGLTSMTIPEGVTSIGSAAFSACSGLTSVTIPASVTKIEKGTFGGCTGLTSVEIPKSVESIGDDAFRYCTGLINIKIPERVHYIGKTAFCNCSNLRSVTIDGAVTSMGMFAFRDCGSLTSVYFSEGTTIIGDRAFYGCPSLTSVHFPHTLTSIERMAFYQCDKLTGISIPDAIEKIENRAFSGCSSITNIRIPAGITTLDSGAFEKCSSLKEIIVECGPESFSKSQPRPFNEVTANVYYHDDGTWTEDDRRRQGSGLTWIPIDSGVRFIDVSDSSEYFFDPVYWAVDRGITSGTSATTFSPYSPCTRGQVMSFLYKASGSPEVNGANPFTDVKESDYFYKPVLWAVENKITSGTSATTFSPYNTCTRAQVMAFLYKAKGSPEVSGSNPFTDVKEGDYFYKSVLWAVENKITSGTSATTFSPYNTCTRAQVMTFLYKALA